VQNVPSTCTQNSEAFWPVQYVSATGGSRASPGGPAIIHAAARWPGRLDGSELLALAPWLEAVQAAARPGEPPVAALGLYAVYAGHSDSSDAVLPWRVGFSRRVQDDLADYAVSDPDRAEFVRVKLLGHERVMWTRARLEAERASWAQELGLPADSAAAQEHSRSTAASEARRAADILTAVDRQAFEERKWKMELAMGHNLAKAEPGGDEEAARRRLDFLRAVEGDDWSEVIDGQTQKTVAPADAALPQEMLSPFASGGLGGGAPDTSSVSRELTVPNVEAVLEAVRPVLQADGGDIEVLGVNADRGVVMLGFLGACTTCPASGTTMEDGIERALYDHFGREVVKEVVRLDSGAEAVSDEGIRAGVEAHLASLRESLGADGATVELAPGQGDGAVEVEFSGPPMLFELIRSSLTHRFPELTGRLVVKHVQAETVQ